jgi:hypothetical protein
VELVEVDPLDAEAPERSLDLAPDPLRAQVALGLVVRPVVVGDHAALRKDERPVRGGHLAECAPDDLLGVAEAVDSRRVDPVHAAADSVTDRGNRAGVVLGPPAVGPASAADRPRAEPHRRDFEVSSPESSFVGCHGFSSSQRLIATFMPPEPSAETRGKRLDPTALCGFGTNALRVPQLAAGGYERIS